MKKYNCYCCNKEISGYQLHVKYSIQLGFKIVLCGKCKSTIH